MQRTAVRHPRAVPARSPCSAGRRHDRRAPSRRRAVLIFASNQDMPNIDPAVTPMSVFTASALIALYDPLLMYRGDKMLPHLATSVTPSADATEWTIKLTPAAKFQDGSPVTAEAVKYTLRARAPDQEGAGVDVAADHGRQERHRRRRPDAAREAHEAVLALRPHAAEPPGREPEGREGQRQGRRRPGVAGQQQRRIGALQDQPRELAARRAVRAHRRRRATGRAGPRTGRLDGYVWKVIRESSAQKLALIKGEVHGAQNISPDDIAELMKTPGAARRAVHRRQPAPDRHARPSRQQVPGRHQRPQGARPRLRLLRGAEDLRRQRRGLEGPGAAPGGRLRRRPAALRLRPRQGQGLSRQVRRGRPAASPSTTSIRPASTWPRTSAPSSSPAPPS